MRAGNRAQAVRQGDGPRHAGAETDAVVRAGHIVVHGLGDRQDPNALLVQAHTVAQRVVAADRNQVVDAQESKVLQDLRREVVRLGVILVLEVIRNIGGLDAARIGARGMQECATGSPGAIDDLLGQLLKVLAVVGRGVPDNVDQAAPSSTEADHPIALVQSPEGHRADCGIQSGNITAAGENSQWFPFSLSSIPSPHELFVMHVQPRIIRTEQLRPPRPRAGKRCDATDRWPWRTPVPALRLRAANGGAPPRCSPNQVQLTIDRLELGMGLVPSSGPAQAIGPCHFAVKVRHGRLILSLSKTTLCILSPSRLPCACGQ